MHETATSTSDGKTRMVQVAFAAGLPGFVVAIYLWPAYHPFPGWPPGRTVAELPPYWAQVNHHFFFVVYSFVAMGLVTVFEWDLFFPDRLDVFVLGTLPIAPSRLFLARVSAIAILLAGFLFDSNFLAPIVLPMATDPPQLSRFLLGHVSAVAFAGLFGAGLVLALEGALLAVLGERWFRHVSLLLQGACVAAFLVLLLLFPVLTGVTPAMLQSAGAVVRWFPPFWFLGWYQERLPAEGNLPWGDLAWRGVIATVVVWGVAIVAYPLAHVRRVRALVEGASSTGRQSPLLRPWHRLAHFTVARSPLRRAVFHFIGQTLLRVPRYRIYLVLYCGAGFSLLVASILRFNVHGGAIRAEVSADGIRIATGIVAFWVIAGLRSTFASPGNAQGGWIFRSIHGNPPRFEEALERLDAASVWVLACGETITLAATALLQSIAPAELRNWNSLAAQLLTGAGMALLLTDAFFLNVTAVPFTGEQAGVEHNLAFTVLRYFTFFPFVTWFSLMSEKWMEAGGARLGIALASIALAHLWLRKRRRDTVRIYANQLPVEEGEEDFPMRLGLRY